VTTPAEAEVQEKLKEFMARCVKNTKELTANKLVEEGAINPFLVKALGITDFDSLAKFYVYQRVGRSLVTSFGAAIEHLVRALARGTRQGWWDAVQTIGGTPYFMAVKSGPRDMDKDQVKYFAQKAREILKQDPNAVPVIAIGYGRTPWPIIVKTLEEEGLDPKKHLLVGRELYARITGQPDYHGKLLIITDRVALKELAGKKVIDIIEDKVKEVARDFKKKYKTVDDLLLDTF
jgi:hypothetical protein